MFAGAETDRITYHGFTVILKALDVLLFCYIFKGQSYLALQKLEEFKERVRSTPAIWKTLIKVMKTDSVLKRVDDIGAKDEIGLNQLITDIFQLRSNKALK